MTLTRRSLLALTVVFGLAPSMSFAETQTLTATAAYEGVNDGSLILVDVRRPDEWISTGVAPGAWLLDMSQENFVAYLMAVIEQNPDHAVAVICRTGNRTGQLVAWLEQNNIKGVLDVTEGMVGGPNGPGWLTTGLPVVEAQAAYDAMPKDLVAAPKE